jgi:branched-chain amino acid aminotransferase
MPAEPIAYLRGQVLPVSQAHIAIFDAAVVLGATVTDFTRTFRQQPFRLEDHAERFYRSCTYARIKPPIPIEETLRVSREIVTHNAALLRPDQELGMVYFMSPGEFTVYAGSAGGQSFMMPTFCIHTFPLHFNLWRHYYTDGVHAVVPPTRHVPPQCVSPKAKNRSRLHWWIADQESHEVDPKAVSLLLDIDGNITETGGSNFIMVRRGAVVSPQPRHILWGISIETVRDLCGELGIPFYTEDLQIYDVANADEAMLASTPYCLAPVTRINGLTIGSGATDGPIFSRLMAAWSERVGLDLLQQIMTYEPPAEAMT